MLELHWFIKFLALAAATLGLYHFIKKPERSAEDVLADLQELYPDAEKSERILTAPSKNEQISILKGLKAEIIQQGDAVDASSIKGPIILGALAAVVLAVSVGVVKLHILLISFIAGAALVYLVAGSRLRAKQVALIQEIEQLLPVVMERLVMAVQSGLDIVAALNTVVKLDEQDRAHGQKADPLVELLGTAVNLSESGLSFSAALNQVADAVPCVALRHAFVHLALAYEEGGELVSPLRELSDATQLYYQESVEERIAKLPVKATLPLVLTFAGLIICFITAPILQVMNVLTTVTLK